MKQLKLETPSFQYLETSFREWLDILGYAPSTIYNLPNHVRELLCWLEQHNVTHIHKLDNKHIKEYYDQLRMRSNQRRGGGLSNAYLNKHQQALYKFAEYLRHSGRHVLPSLHLDWEADQSETIQYLLQEEIKLLYEATKKEDGSLEQQAIAARDRAILSVFYGCGLRRNEGYHLDVSDVNFDRRILHVRQGKANKERLVPFNKTNSKYFEEYVYDHRRLLVKDNTEDAFFVSTRNQRMDTQTMALRLKILQQRTEDVNLQEKNVRLHVLRHSIATHLLQNGMALEKISRFLGHSSLESTQVYTHLVEQEAANG